MRASCAGRSILPDAGLALVIAATLWLGSPAPGLAESAPPAEREELDMSPPDPASWSLRYLAAPLVSIVRGPSYMYRPRKIEIEITPSGGFVDLFYVRSGFQKRFEQAEAPVTVVLPSRLKAGPRDSFTIRAFAEGHRQKSVTFRVVAGIDQVEIDLDPLPNHLDGIGHRYFAGRASLSFLTREALTFRLQEANDGIGVILHETAISAEARSAVESMRGPLIDEAYSQQLGEDLMVKLLLTERGLRDQAEVRSRQAYDAPRDLYVFTVDLVPPGGEAASTGRALEVLAGLDAGMVRGCALVYDDRLRDGLGAGELARALAPRGAASDRYLRAAMRRLGELSVDGVVDFVDGGQFRPQEPIELEMAIGNAGGAKGYLALLRSFVQGLESAPEAREASLRSLVAPELSYERFAALRAEAEAAEASCRRGGPGMAANPGSRLTARGRVPRQH
jgi:hypothetical protein